MNLILLPYSKSRYESFHRTMMAARERARRTSMSILGNDHRKSSVAARLENNNQGYVNYGGDSDVLDPSMSETERNLRLRMAKRDALMR